MTKPNFDLNEYVEANIVGRTIARTESIDREEEYLIEYEEGAKKRQVRKWFPASQLTPADPPDNVVHLRSAA